MSDSLVLTLGARAGLLAPLSKNDLRAYAHHEAAHALASIVLNECRQIVNVRVGQHYDDDAPGILLSGRVSYDHESVVLETREELVKVAISTWAGPIAEFRDQQHRRNPETENKRQYFHQGGGKGDREAAYIICQQIAALDLGLTLPAGASSASGSSAKQSNFMIAACRWQKSASASAVGGTTSAAY